MSQLTTAHAADLADRALDSDRVVECECMCGLVAVPDVVMLEGEANGQDTPTTWRLLRDDGRSVHFFLLPPGAK